MPGNCNFKLKLPDIELPSIGFSLPSLPSLKLPDLPSFSFLFGAEVQISIGGVAGPTQIIGDEPRVRIKINIPAPEIPLPSFSLPALPSLRLPDIQLPTLALDIEVKLKLKLPDIQLPSVGFSLPSVSLNLKLPDLPTLPDCPLDLVFD